MRRLSMSQILSAATSETRHCAVILPMSGRKSKFVTDGTRFMGGVFAANTRSGAPAVSSSTSRWRPAWSWWARQEIGQLRSRNRHHAVRDGGPQKTPALKSLHEQARPVAVMPNQLDQVASAPPEDPQIAGMRIAPERLLHHQRQG